ncbi:MAG: sulfurtransferase TusA family protein [Planctomycetaceae bacterium]|nr:sulfurtransferase TusA family protein [Planctomycetales bacterium]MCB9927494.1 sulfurtransferase TusA family protein [Planctomycetaceae bacterium]
MPIVKISKAVREMVAGQTIEIEATDLAFKLDLEAWANKTGHTIRDFSEGEVLRAVVELS